MASNTFTVVGMTCSHCVTSVTEEVNQIPGVQDVDVELATGRLTVHSESELDPGAVEAAIEEAGYQLAAG